MACSKFGLLKALVMQTDITKQLCSLFPPTLQPKALLASYQKLCYEDQVSVIRCLYQRWKNNPAAHQELIYLEDYFITEASATDTLTGLIQILDWLTKERKHATISEILGYLSCCKEMHSVCGLNLPLELIIKQALQEHGFAKAAEY